MKVPLYAFAAFVAGGPSLKIATVADTKHTPPYDPMTDWWKQLREFIPRNHQQGGGKKDLTKFVNSVNPRKQASYTHCAASYVSWWGNRTITPAKGSAATWSAAGVDVTVNPELFLDVDGHRHVVKLYFKSSEKLSADRANIVLRLMELKFGVGKNSPVVGILDLAQGNFLVPSSLAYLDPVLVGEAASFAAIWPTT